MGRLLSLVLLLGVTSLPVVAQDAAPTAPPNGATENKSAKAAVPAGRVTGTVLCGDTHRPARGAALFVEPVPSANPDATAGDNFVGGSGTGMGRVAMDGTYTLEHLAPGEYSVLAALPGYLSPLDEMISGGMIDHSPAAMHDLLTRLGTVTIRGAETERYDITLQRGAAISGRVLYSDGSPATQVSLEVEDIKAKDPANDREKQVQMAASVARVMFTHQSANTDDLGRFRISGLKPATYRVAAVSAAADVSGMEGEEGGMMALLGVTGPGALKVYAGDTLHRKAAKTFELRPGDEVTGIDITIPLNAYHAVKGILTAVDGRPINSATVTLSDTSDNSVSFETEVAGDGTFNFGTVAAGTYTLSAKSAKILVRIDGVNPEAPMRYVPTKPTNAFADGSTAVIVKDSDVPDVALTLTEVPLPPQPVQPAQPIPDD
jgi:hypothetical protein